MDFWQWVSATIPAGALINGGGLLALAGLFATDRVLTKGQHTRRMDDQKVAHEGLVAALKESHAAAVAELVKHHEEVLTIERARYSELGVSRDGWRDTANTERATAQTVTDRLADISFEAAKIAATALQAIERADA